MSGVALVLVLLVAVVVVVGLAGRLRVAYPILLVIVGGALAFVPGLPQIDLDPQLFLLVFLPPLIYSTSLGTSRFELKANRRPILALAVGLVLLTMGAVAAVAHALIPGMSWPVALTLGAIVAPPDAIAATEVAGRVGLPSRLVSILEGEGLINDGTALTAYQLSLAAVGGTVTALSVGRAAVESVVFGVAAGLVAGLLTSRVLRLVDEPVLENTVLLMLPFAAYLPAAAVGGSGVLAVLTAGLWYLRDGRPLLSATGRLQQRSLWQLVAFILTGLSFLLVGLQLHAVVRRVSGGATGIPGGGLRAALTVAALCATIIVVRFVGVFGFAGLPGGRARLRPAEPKEQAAAGGSRLPEPQHRVQRQVSWRSVTVISWAGMRGAVSLAAALALGHDVPYREVIILVTFAVIVVTLVGQGLTLPVLVRRLHVVSPARESEFELLRARHRLTVAALRRLADEVPDPAPDTGEAPGGEQDAEPAEEPAAGPEDELDDEADDSPQAEGLAQVAALYQRQLDRLESALADFADGEDPADGVVPDAQAARDVREALPAASSSGAALPAGAAEAGADQAAAGNMDHPARDREEAVRTAFRGYVDDVRDAQRAELDRLEGRGAVGHAVAERLRSRLDATELGLPARGP